MAVTQKQFDDLRAYMERRFAEMLANMPNPPVRLTMMDSKSQAIIWVTLDEDLIKPATATATVVGSTRKIEVGSFILETDQMVAAAEVIGVLESSNYQAAALDKYQFALGRCTQVTDVV